MVRIKNRSSCCGSRLAFTTVWVGAEECGSVQAGTVKGEWYEVTCAKPVRGANVKLQTTTNTYLHFEGIEVHAEKTESSMKTLEDFDTKFESKKDARPAAVPPPSIPKKKATGTGTTRPKPPKPTYTWKEESNYYTPTTSRSYKRAGTTGKESVVDEFIDWIGSVYESSSAHVDYPSTKSSTPKKINYYADYYNGG